MQPSILTFFLSAMDNFTQLNEWFHRITQQYNTNLKKEWSCMQPYTNEKPVKKLCVPPQLKQNSHQLFQWSIHNAPENYHYPVNTTATFHNKKRIAPQNPNTATTLTTAVHSSAVVHAVAQLCRPQVPSESHLVYASAASDRNTTRCSPAEQPPITPRSATSWDGQPLLPLYDDEAAGSEAKIQARCANLERSGRLEEGGAYERTRWERARARAGARVGDANGRGGNYWGAKCVFWLAVAGIQAVWFSSIIYRTVKS